MRALIAREFGSPELLYLGDVPTPAPGPDEVLIKVHATSINFVDLLVIGGKYQFCPELPFVPGKGPAGIVSEVGENVSNVSVGQRVLAMSEVGGFGEYAVAAKEQCYPLPDCMSFPDAAAIAVGFDTAWIALKDRARINPGDSVLVLGASGTVGFAAIQLAKAKGAGTVFAGISSPKKKEFVLAAGAEGTIDLAGPDLRDSLRDQVYSKTEGNGVDIILDPLGGDFCDAAIRALAWRGRLVIIGFASGRIPTIKANYLLLKNIEVSGLQVSDYRKRAADEMTRCFDDLFALYTAGKIKPPPICEFELSDYGDAFQHLTNRNISDRVILHQ